MIKQNEVWHSQFSVSYIAFIKLHFAENPIEIGQLQSWAELLGHIPAPLSQCCTLEEPSLRCTVCALQHWLGGRGGGYQTLKSIQQTSKSNSHHFSLSLCIIHTFTVKNDQVSQANITTFAVLYMRNLLVFLNC